jgi:hypothetical protein
MYDMGSCALPPLQRNLCYRFLSLLKIHQPQLHLNPQNLGSSGEHITSRPLRQVTDNKSLLGTHEVSLASLERESDSALYTILLFLRVLQSTGRERKKCLPVCRKQFTWRKCKLPKVGSSAWQYPILPVVACATVPCQACYSDISRQCNEKLPVCFRNIRLLHTHKSSLYYGAFPSTLLSWSCSMICTKDWLKGFHFKDAWRSSTLKIVLQEVVYGGFHDDTENIPALWHSAYIHIQGKQYSFPWITL